MQLQLFHPRQILTEELLTSSDRHSTAVVKRACSHCSAYPTVLRSSRTVERDAHVRNEFPELVSCTHPQIDATPEPLHTKRQMQLVLLMVWDATLASYLPINDVQSHMLEMTPAP